jgi:hypothetical protein
VLINVFETIVPGRSWSLPAVSVSDPKMSVPILCSNEDASFLFFSVESADINGANIRLTNHFSLLLSKYIPLAQIPYEHNFGIGGIEEWVEGPGQ